MHESGEYAQSNARENVSIVALARLEGFTVDCDRWEWRTGTENNTSLSKNGRECDFFLFLFLKVDSQLTSVFSKASWAVHSARLVGFDNAKTIGFSLFLPMSRNISGVNRPGVADAPIKIWKNETIQF